MHRNVALWSGMIIDTTQRNGLTSLRQYFSRRALKCICTKDLYIRLCETIYVALLTVLTCNSVPFTVQRMKAAAGVMITGK